MGIKHVAYRIAHESPAGVAGLADQMGIGKQVLLNKLNANSTSHHLNIQELEMIADFTGSNLKLAEYFAHKDHAVVIQLPQVELGDMAILDGFLIVGGDFGDFCNEFRKDYGDGKITKKEFKELQRDVLKVQKHLLMVLAMIEELVTE